MGPLNDNPRTVCLSEKLRPSMRNGSMPQTPCGPLVILIGRERLLRKMRMISPNPRVTIAR